MIGKNGEREREREREREKGSEKSVQATLLDIDNDDLFIFKKWTFYLIRLWG